VTGRDAGQPALTPDVLAEPGARIRAVLDGIFGPLAVVGTAFATQRRTCRAAGDELTPDRLSGLREIVWRQLGLLPAADGAGIVAAPGVIAGKDRHLEWWQRPASGEGTADGFARIRADSRFHIEVAQASQSERLTRLEVGLQTQLGELLWLPPEPTGATSVAGATELLDHLAVSAEHAAIADAIAAEDGDRARMLAEGHVERNLRRLTALRLAMAQG